jgi:hypothetical protein
MYPVATDYLPLSANDNRVVTGLTALQTALGVSV